MFSLFLFFNLTLSFTLKSGRIPLWFLQFITGNNYCKSIVCFHGSDCETAVCPKFTTSSSSERFHCDYRNYSCICALGKKQCTWSAIWPSTRAPRLASPQLVTAETGSSISWQSSQSLPWLDLTDQKSWLYYYDFIHEFVFRLYSCICIYNLSSTFRLFSCRA